MPVITVSSTFGAGGSVVAAQVAASLKWKLINRAIPAEVAEELSVPLEVAAANDEQLDSRFWRALVRSAMSLAADAGRELPREAFKGEDAFRAVTEALVKRLADSSDCVIVGRAANIILHGRTDTLHVRLDGPADARLRQAMEALQLTEDQARRRLQQTDRARREYVRHFYRRDWADSALYHLVIDSTALPLVACEQVIIAAAAGRGLTTKPILSTL